MYKNDESLELFFSTLDEETMDKLIDIYERNDEKALDAFLNETTLDVPKKDLMESMERLIEMKNMMGDFY